MAAHLGSLDASGLCTLEDTLKIGVHWDVDVTDAPTDASADAGADATAG